MSSVVSRSLVVVALVCVVAGCRGKTEAGPEEPPPPPPLVEVTVEAAGLTAASPQAVQSLTDIAVQYESLQGEVDQTNRKLLETMTRYQRRSGSLPPNFGPNLTAEQRALLTDLITKEKAGTRSMLQEILDRDQRIKDLRAQLDGLSQRLPDHTVAKAGDRHDRIAMSYLISKGISAEKAYGIVSQVSLQDVLVPGFNVWTYYANGQFGTWVTRGRASMTPQEQQQYVMKSLTSARDQALKAKTDLQGQLVAAQLEAQTKVQAAEEQSKNASAETGAVLDMLAKAEESKRASESTLYYLAGSSKQLEKRKIIKGKRILAFDAALLTRVDASTQREIALDPPMFELKTIKKVTLLPEVFVLGADYGIDRGAYGVKLQLLNVEKLRRNQFVIVVE